MGENVQLVEVRLEGFVLVEDFMQEGFVLNNFPFLKWEGNLK